MNLLRYAPAQRVPGWRVSAWWEFEDYPGLFVFQESRLEMQEDGRTGKPLWYLTCSSEATALIQDRVFPKLQHQAFPTRREALQAVEMALVLIEAEEEM